MRVTVQKTYDRPHVFPGNAFPPVSYPTPSYPATDNTQRNSYKHKPE
jgi:hypothetical protein